MDAGQLGARNMSVAWLEIPAGRWNRRSRSDEVAEQVYVVVRGAGTMLGGRRHARTWGRGT